MQHAFKLDDEKNLASPQMSKIINYDFPQDLKNWNHIAFVGEAPGAEEVRLGHPFVGRSGQLLDKMLERAGINRKDSLIANIFRMQPPGNKVDHFFISRGKAKKEKTGICEKHGQFGSNFCREEFAGELDHLKKTIEKLKPKILIALGRTPLWALTSENGLLSKVGKPLPGTLVPGIDVIPTYHPSFIMRGNWGLQDEWLGHFLSAKKLIV
ncbi:MAG: uracil-DNA glycosylase [Alphaproteobacteria bacterium]